MKFWCKFDTDHLKLTEIAKKLRKKLLTDNEHCPYHPNTEVTKIVLPEIGLYYRRQYI